MQRIPPLALSPIARSRRCLMQLGTPGPASPASVLVSASHAPAKPPRSRLTSQRGRLDWRSDMPASRRPVRCRFLLVSLPSWSSRSMQEMLPRSWCGGGWYSAGRFLKAARHVPNCASPVRRRDVRMEEALPLPFWIPSNSSDLDFSATARREDSDRPS